MPLRCQTFLLLVLLSNWGLRETVEWRSEPCSLFVCLFVYRTLHRLYRSRQHNLHTDEHIYTKTTFNCPSLFFLLGTFSSIITFFLFLFLVRSEESIKLTCGYNKTGVFLFDGWLVYLPFEEVDLSAGRNTNSLWCCEGDEGRDHLKMFGWFLILQEVRGNAR